MHGPASAFLQDPGIAIDALCKICFAKPLAPVMQSGGKTGSDGDWTSFGGRCAVAQPS